MSVRPDHAPFFASLLPLTVSSHRYRRIFFVGIIPLLSPNKLERCAIGLSLSIVSMVSYRELQPFALEETSNNISLV